ncbi:MAG TPA: ATP-binding protein [Leptolyngbyaceae cyanobacterium]
MNKTKILIVEDELLIATNLSRKLERIGYFVVDIVSSGVAAIERAAETKPDLILMDIVIKGDIDGIETAAQIHKKLDIPVIYTTAYADDNTLERAEKTGSYGYVIKPFKERELHATIKMALSKHKEGKKIKSSLQEAKDSSEDKSRYFSIASHDLRTPLSIIQISAYMLENYDSLWDKQIKNKHFDRIKIAVKNMIQMLEDMLTLSKAESGKLKLKPSPCEAIGFCRSLIDELTVICSPKHQLIFESKETSIIANLDINLLRYMLTNLITNAIKYSPKGGTINLVVNSQQEQVIFRVEDRGIGIPPAYQAKLFQQFERGSNVGNIQGTGLGLFIVKEVVDLHGGKISVESQVGVGTTFTIYLPLRNEKLNSKD